jgi:hypothetical protein
LAIILPLVTVIASLKQLVLSQDLNLHYVDRGKTLSLIFALVKIIAQKGCHLKRGHAYDTGNWDKEL